METTGGICDRLRPGMKFTLARNLQAPRSRNEAWACFTANLAWPGSGSLAAGKSVGFGQTAIAFVGLIVSLVTGAHLLTWMIANRARLADPSDPIENLAMIWHQIRWPLVGLGIFAIAFVWALITSAQILAATPKDSTPPRIV
jgi:hypothetical protein